jgi:hypothetical protein
MSTARETNDVLDEHGVEDSTARSGSTIHRLSADPLMAFCHGEGQHKANAGAYFVS